MQAQDKGVEIMNGCGSIHSPRHVSALSMSQESRSYTSKSMFVSESFSSFSSSSTTCYSVSTSHSSTTVNGNESRIITPTKFPRSGSDDQAEATSPSSFIVQRVERLYGPGALAQGFYTRRTSTSNITSRKSVEHGKDMKTSYSVDEMNSVKTEDSLPVFKLLRPEFRAQLSLASRKSKTIPLEEVQERKSESANYEEAIENKIMGDEVDATIESRHDSHLKPELKDGHYFLKLLEEQVSKLESLASAAEEELKTCTSEEGCGILRAAAGKARLLVAQKLKQFSGLCQNNIKQSSTDDFPTTNEDLAGFWDMVMIQVREVITQFEDMKSLRANNWRSPKAEGDKVTTNGSSRGSGSGVRRGLQKRTSSADPKVTAASKARDDARKKMLEERRKAMRENKMNNDVLIIS